MSGSTANDTCRLTVVTPQGWVELAVPDDVPLADLMPVLLVQGGGAPLAETGMEHGGWVLQRLGGAVLDEDRTPDALGLVHGETLYLRPRREALPELEFDDLVDGVADGLNDRPGRWSDRAARAFLLACGPLLSLAPAPLLVTARAPAAARGGAALAVAAALVVTAALCARRVGDARAAVLAGATAVPYAAVGGMLLGADGRVAAAQAVLCGGAAVLGAASAGMAALGAVSGPCLAAAVAGAAALLGGVLSAAVPLTLVQAAAVVAMAALAALPFLPVLAFRLAGLRLPALPTSAEDLQEDVAPVARDLVVHRVAAVDRHLTALMAGIGVVGAVCLTPLAFDPGWSEAGLVVAVAAVLALRSRTTSAVGQRAATLLPAGYGVVLLLLVRLAAAVPTTRVTVAAVGAVLALWLALGAARVLPGRRLLPYWGRAAELGESLAAVAVPVLVLAVLHAYSAARGLG